MHNCDYVYLIKHIKNKEHKILCLHITAIITKEVERCSHLL